MATIINNPGDDSGSAVSLLMFIILLIVLVGGGYYLYRHGAFRGGAPSSTNINVQIPNPVGGGSGAQ